MMAFNKFFLALAFLGGSAAVQAAYSTADASRIDLGRTSKKLTGIMLPGAAKLSDATPAMSGAYASGLSSLSQSPDSYLPAHHRL
jgi:hypothetical protein